MIYKKEKVLGGRGFQIETGKLARQADGTAWVQYGDTVILANVVATRTPAEEQDFFPLSVEYREKAYAAGKIPGGFFKREGKPSEKEILSARLIDRSLRPLFPENFKNEVQIIVSVLSSDKENDADVLGIVGASAALALSHIPFEGPIASVRVGRINGEMIINPTFGQLGVSDMNLVIAGSEDSIIMVEGEANEISEADMLAALDFGHQALKEIIAMQRELIAECGREKIIPEAPEVNPELIQEVRELSRAKLLEANTIADKIQRKLALEQLVLEVQTTLAEKYPDSEDVILKALGDFERELVRKMITEEGKRIDGRGLKDVRPISCEVGVLPRAHGSALFTRGQTQALAATTLGTKMDEQKIEELEGEFWKTYMLHYNFPPFSVGEVRPIRGPSRREIGHGFLAERALKPMIPSDAIFPYTIRIVSDILESNGSSSMATVCAASLSLMDAGVPVKDSVAGIAMGLIKENDKISILTDILGDEDHLGDMDFKVAGTQKGITAFQMDIKIRGISLDIMKEALEQARQARLYVLDIMNKTLDKPRSELSPYAPRIISFKVAVDTIGTIIGPGGKTIRDIIDRTGASIDIEDDGTVIVASVDPQAGERARQLIEALVQEPEVGKTYIGKVKRIMNFGAFIEILPGKEGLLHISEIEHHRINRVEDVLKLGDEVTVKVIKIDPQGKIDLSRKALLERKPEFSPQPYPKNFGR